MRFTQEKADKVKAWIDKQVGKDCRKVEVENRPHDISDEDDGFLRSAPSGDTIIYMEFTSVKGV